MLGQKPSWHWEISIGFSAALWFIVFFKSALRLHYIPLCLLENHYGAIKSNVVSHTNMEFSSVSDGCALPSCLLWFVHLWWSRDTAVGKTLNRWQLRGDASSFFGCSLTPERGTSLNAGVQLTVLKKHGSGKFSDKIHLAPRMKRNWNVLMIWNVQYNSKRYCPWKLFNYSN